MPSEQAPIEIISEGISFAAQAVILVPRDAPELPGKLAGFAPLNRSEQKHVLWTLSQIALFDLEEKILPVARVPDAAPISAVVEGEERSVDCGIIIARAESGEVRILAHESADIYGLVKFAHRHCTRWVRLDI